MRSSRRKGTFAESLTEPGHLLFLLLILLILFALIVAASKPAYPVAEKTAKILNCLHGAWSVCLSLLSFG